MLTYLLLAYGLSGSLYLAARLNTRRPPHGLTAPETGLFCCPRDCVRTANKGGKTSKHGEL